MSKIKKAFENKKAFIAFITCGDPDLETTKEVVKEAVKNGADLIELGIPVSDPTAEGPVIQGANIRALKGGVTTDKVFDLVRELRLEIDVPMVFMTYANVIFVYGIEKFAKRYKEIGISGVIIPDVPFEEKEEMDSVFSQYDLEVISLIAPTSHDRIQAIAAEAKGFVYCVSSLGVTGMRSTINKGVATMIEQVKATRDVPCAIGFGISTPEQAKEMAQISDGVIVGSAIVKLVETYGKNCMEPVADYVKSMKEAISEV